MRAIIGSLWGLILLFCMVSRVQAESIPVVSRKSGEKPYIVVELFVSQKEYVVGEIIPYTVRCTYDAQSYSVNMIAPPANAELGLFALSEAKRGQTTINGSSCILYEWQGTFYAKKSGMHEYGPFQVGGEQTSTHASRNFFRMMWNSSFTLYSNTVMIQVRDLPQKSFPNKNTGYFPVGSWHYAHIELEQVTMKSGEAQTLRYILEGEGNTSLLDHPVLDLPTGLKYYTAEKKHESKTRTVFEYVLQALEPGSLNIPQQQFFYFDPQLHAYRALKTLPVRLNVTQGAAIQKSEPEIPAEENTTPETSETAPVSVQDTKNSYIRMIEIPQKIFMNMLCMIGVCILYLSWYENLAEGYRFFKKRKKYRALLRGIRLGYKNFRRDRNSSMLYEHFKELSNVYCPDTKEWYCFWNRLECVRFGQELHHDEQDYFLQEVQTWTTYFEKKLWQKK